MIPETLQQELKQRVAAAVTPREAAVDIMRAIQGEYGWLTDEGVAEAAAILGLSPLQVEELATFYEMIYRRPVGKRVIHLCDSISCWSTGSETLLHHLSHKLGIAPGETTKDGLFTLLPCACLGNCGEGPTMMIDNTLYGPVTLERVEEILATEQRQLR
ncbi:MAG TPA: NADH-quinone oxidoreductase subunit NuoE [Geobacterales bacterium]|nr:NADH-quinone oxidoreductase subunit NuoE [Geobacterales bacterium]